MKRLVILGCASLVAVSGPAVAKTAPSPLKLTAAGEGRVKCTFEDARGNIVRHDLNPEKGGEAEYSNSRFDHGACEYKAASGGQLTITVEGDAWICPLRSDAGTVCTQNFAGGAAGSFRLTRREGS